MLLLPLIFIFLRSFYFSLVIFQLLVLLESHFVHLFLPVLVHFGQCVVLALGVYFGELPLNLLLPELLHWHVRALVGAVGLANLH